MTPIHQITLHSALVNVGLAIFQLVLGYITSSKALLADGLHTVSDLLSDGIVAYAHHHAKKEPDAEHGYGHARYENAATLILGILLFLTGIWMIFSFTQQLLSDDLTPTPPHWLAFWAALIALMTKEILFRYLQRKATQYRSALLMANAWHSRSDAASSLIVCISLLGAWAGFYWMDTLAALLVGALILKMGFHFFWDALQDLMDRNSTPETLQEFECILQNVPGVLSFHALKTRKMGDALWIDVHLEVDPHITVKEAHDISTDAKKALMNSDHSVMEVMIHLDPLEANMDESETNKVSSKTYHLH